MKKYIRKCDFLRKNISENVIFYGKISENVIFTMKYRMVISIHFRTSLPFC